MALEVDFKKGEKIHFLRKPKSFSRRKLFGLGLSPFKAGIKGMKGPK
ncbi:MAG: hypothetical protein Q7S21_03125 [archaeon]|nr:hypothetical protein [archaeon]